MLSVSITLNLYILYVLYVVYLYIVYLYVVNLHVVYLPSWATWRSQDVLMIIPNNNSAAWHYIGKFGLISVLKLFNMFLTFLNYCVKMLWEKLKITQYSRLSSHFCDSCATGLGQIIENNTLISL